MALIKPVEFPQTRVNRKPMISGITKVELKGSNPFKDSDKDGIIDFVDCKPKNPNKQGFMDFVKHQTSKVAQKVSSAYKEYKAAEPERRKKELVRLEHKRKVWGERAAIEQQRAKISKARESTRKARPPMGQPVGLGGAGLSPVEATDWYWKTKKKPAMKPVKIKRKKSKKKAKTFRLVPT